MARWETFTFRVNQRERQLIASLAEQLQRSQSDAIRFVVVNAAQQLANAPSNQNGKNISDPGRANG